MKVDKSIYSCALCLVLNMALAFAAYLLCRVEFILENWGALSSNIGNGAAAAIYGGGLRFDTSAIIYTNLPYILLMLLPVAWKESDGWQRVAKWVFVGVNSLCVCINLADSVYFAYTGRRTTASVFAEFGNEGNIASIVGIELLRHWYLVVLAAVMVWGLWRLYFMPSGAVPEGLRRPYRPKAVLRYTGLQLLFLLIAAPLCIAGMRGGFTTAVRPITISNANQYAANSTQAAAVLNTPFALLRTAGKKVFTVPDYMTDAEMEVLYSPVHIPADSLSPKVRNVVILIVESFGREYIGAYNRGLDNGTYRGYTPFVDSLMEHSATWELTFANGRKSIDGMPSVLSSIPMFVEPFFLTPASMNSISSLASELGRTGYHSAFFHGAENGSMGFQAFARSAKFDQYYGRTEYNADGRFGGDSDFDGTWAIWDEPFLQFFALKMSEFPQPFVSAIFTASSHHPFVIPREYEAAYPEEGLPIHKCIRYTDNALRLFFDTARRQPWFDNTIFVLTADHTNQSNHSYYSSDFGRWMVPILIYDPSGEIEPGMREGIAQQIDIMPTVLNHLGYPYPYVAFGKDLFATPGDEQWAVNYAGGIYGYVQGDYSLLFDGENVKGLYHMPSDSLQQHNLAGTLPEAEQPMKRRLKAIIRSYMQRMTTDSLTIALPLEPPSE